MAKKKKVAIFTTPQGHVRIAQAIAAKIQSLAGDQFETVQFFVKPVLMKEYSAIYKFAPFLYVVLYTLTKFKPAYALLEKVERRVFDAKIRDFIERERPDICINTNFVFKPGLEKICEEYSIPFVNVLANLGVVHPMEVSRKASANLTLDDRTRDALKQKYPDCTFVSAGWFVNPEFEKMYSQTVAKKRYPIDPDTLHLLLVSGWEGTSGILKILPFLLQVKKRVIVTVVCGKSAFLANEVKAIAQFLKKAAPFIDMRILTFTTKLHEYMRTADIVVGKAGPNTLFESVATNTPFFALTHVTGHEDANLRLICSEKLGYVEENMFAASKLLTSIVNQPGTLGTFTQPLSKMAQHNKQSGATLVKLLSQLT